MNGIALLPMVVPILGPVLLRGCTNMAVTGLAIVAQDCLSTCCDGQRTTLYFLHQTEILHQPLCHKLNQTMEDVAAEVHRITECLYLPSLKVSMIQCTQLHLLIGNPSTMIAKDNQLTVVASP